jgi:hypothetical protein
MGVTPMPGLASLALAAWRLYVVVSASVSVGVRTPVWSARSAAARPAWVRSCSGVASPHWRRKTRCPWLMERLPTTRAEKI